MEERAALSLLAEELDAAGDDAAVVEELVLTTDMLHESADFPTGTTRYTAGWRSVGASLSDVAAMGAKAVATVAVYASPSFDRAEIKSFIGGASDVSERVGAAYVGGDLDQHDEFTVVTAAVGRTEEPVYRSGASPGEVVCVTGTLGRTAAALQHFDAGNSDRGNELFRFAPRIQAAQTLGSHASAMMDSSDGLARSLHQLADASDCGFGIDSDAIPIDQSVLDLAEQHGASTDEERTALELASIVGEDFELVATVPQDAIQTVREQTEIPITPIGTTTDRGIEMDGARLPDEGYSHGE